MATAISNFFRRRRTSNGGGNNKSHPPSSGSAMTTRALALKHPDPARSPHSPPAPAGLRAAITRFRGEADADYEARLARIEDYLQQELQTIANDSNHPAHAHCPLSPAGGAAAGPLRVPSFGSASAASSGVSACSAASSSSLCTVPAPLLRAVTRLKNEPEQAYVERVRQMTEELDSYCRSESFRIEFRRPDGNGWLTPAEAEAKGLCS